MLEDKLNDNILLQVCGLSWKLDLSIYSSKVHTVHLGIFLSYIERNLAAYLKYSSELHLLHLTVGAGSMCWISIQNNSVLFVVTTKICSNGSDIQIIKTRCYKETL